jgi:hypothetical protein
MAWYASVKASRNASITDDRSNHIFAAYLGRTVWVTQSQETTACGRKQQSDVPHQPSRMMGFLVAEATRTGASELPR